MIRLSAWKAAFARFHVGISRAINIGSNLAFAAYASLQLVADFLRGRTFACAADEEGGCNGGENRKESFHPVTLEVCPSVAIKCASNFIGYWNVARELREFAACSGTRAGCAGIASPPTRCPDN